MTRHGVHEAAAGGYGIGAATYRSARPAYHGELVDRFVELYGRGPVVDLGAGTGIFTAQLVERGVDVVAIEPVASMRDELADSVDVVVHEGTASSMPVDDRSAATVVAAQAFHWFDAGPSLDEIARVLRPGGHLVTVWNVRDESVPWVAEYTDVVDRHAGDTPRHRTMRWRAAIDADDRFELVDDWHVDHPVPTDADGVVARARSTSFIAALDVEEQDAIERELRRITRPLGSSFDYPYRAELQAWRRR